MTWLYLAIAAYALNAVAFVIDKYLLSKPILNPISYAFWVGILSLVVLVILPFGVFWVNSYYFLISFASGAAFFFSLLFLYKTIKKSDITTASTKVGVLGVIFTFILSVPILQDYFYGLDVVAIALMVAGILFLGKTSGKKVWLEALIAGIAFGISTILLKWTFNYGTFLNGFFWTRMGLVGMAFLALIQTPVRKEVVLSFKNSPHSSRFIFLVNKIIAGIGFALLYLAIKLGNVSVVNALLSIQFAFIFLFAFIFREKIPGISENLTNPVVARKITGIVLAAVGLLLLFR